DERVHTLIPPKTTAGHLRGLLGTLEGLVAAEPEKREARRTAAAAALDEVAERIHRRALVVVVTDLFENVAAHDALLKALRHLRYRGHEVLVFHVLDAATERRFAFPDVPVVFRDLETGEEVTLQPAQLRESYREAVTAFTERFRRRCREMHVDFVELDTAQPYDAALLAYLNKRRRLYGARGRSDEAQSPRAGLSAQHRHLPAHGAGRPRGADEVGAAGEAGRVEAEPVRARRHLAVVQHGHAAPERVEHGDADGLGGGQREREGGVVGVGVWCRRWAYA